MKSRPVRHDKSLNKDKTAVDEILNKLYTQAKAQFGAAVKSFWFYDGDLCPACTQRPIGVVKFKGKDALAINAFIYRERSVLIGYFLCETCAKYIFKEAQKNPYKQTPIHADIERNLIAAYHKHLASLDACASDHGVAKHLQEEHSPQKLFWFRKAIFQIHRQIFSEIWQGFAHKEIRHFQTVPTHVRMNRLPTVTPAEAVELFEVSNACAVMTSGPSATKAVGRHCIRADQGAIDQKIYIVDCHVVACGCRKCETFLTFAPLEGDVRFTVGDVRSDTSAVKLHT